jgi:5-oxoprolinase (ATP-hydrolysing) subunit A
MKTIDLNCDMGESFGVYRLGMDEEVIKHISSANIACGWHAGDPMVMARTVRMAADHGVAVGAHPGYSDLMGFGRRTFHCSLPEVKNYVLYQIGALLAFCKANGIKLRHVKPHGGLYNLASADPDVAMAIGEAIAGVDRDMLYVGLGGTSGRSSAKAVEGLCLRAIREGFPDRAYTPEGTLLSRRLPGAVISDPEEVASRALLMAKENKVTATDGSTIELNVQTLCVHGDNPAAVDLVKRVRQALESEGIGIKPMGKMA